MGTLFYFLAPFCITYLLWILFNSTWVLNFADDVLRDQRTKTAKKEQDELDKKNGKFVPKPNIKDDFTIFGTTKGRLWFTILTLFVMLWMWAGFLFTAHWPFFLIVIIKDKLTTATGVYKLERNRMLKKIAGAISNITTIAVLVALIYDLNAHITNFPSLWHLAKMHVYISSSFMAAYILYRIIKKSIKNNQKSESNTLSKEWSDYEPGIRYKKVSLKERPGFVFEFQIRNLDNTAWLTASIGDDFIYALTTSRDLRDALK